MLFLPTDGALRAKCERTLESAVAHYGLTPLGWRDVPGDTACLGDLARAAEPSWPADSRSAN